MQIVQSGQATNYEYDGTGKVKSLKYSCGSENKNIQYNYDEEARIKGIALNGNVVSEYSYTYGGKVDYIKNYRKFDTSGSAFTEVKYKYDSTGMPVSIAYLENGAEALTKEKHELTFDNGGRILNEKYTSDYTNADYTKTDYDNKDSNKEINTSLDRNYSYDELGRLITTKTASKITDKPDKNSTLNYTYDITGNRLSMSDEKDCFIYSYNKFNNLNTVKKNGSIKSTYTYDANGNQIKEVTNREKDEEPGKEAATVTKNFVYDNADRLNTVNISDGKNLERITNYYNGNGQRIKQIAAAGKSEAELSKGFETNYYYESGNLLYTDDGNHRLIEDHILDPAGNIMFSRRFDGSYANMYFMYSYDARGSVTNIVNPDGKLVKGYNYDEFGDTKDRGDKTFKNDVKFTGAVHDTSAGLYYMNDRFYNPTTGRFLTEDTYDGNPYTPWTQHLYGYKNDVKFTGAVHDTSTGLYYMNDRFYNPTTGRFLTEDTYGGNPYTPWTQHLSDRYHCQYPRRTL